MSVYEIAKRWTELSVFDNETKNIVEKMLKNDDELQMCFGNELSFGTGGLRGIIGVGTNRMNNYTVAKATSGLAKYLLENDGKSVAISHDSRHCSREFALVSAGVLAKYGIKAYLFDRLMPTPVLSFATREMNADAGIMITASHNPSKYNGYKVYGSDGCQITDEAANKITKEINNIDYADISWLNDDEARKQNLLTSMPENILENFIEKTLECRVFPNAKSKIKVCYTPLNGAGFEPVTKVLAQMKGVEVVQVKEQAKPDGNFPTCPKPNPELVETLQLAIETAKRNNADIVIATDPDSDRIGVVVKNENEYTILSGNEVGLLLLEAIANKKQQTGALPKEAQVVKTIVTSDLTFAIAKNYNIKVKETLTGFKYIGEEIGKLEKEGKEDCYIFGFEESCGYLAGTHVRDKDGVMAAMLVCELLQNCFDNQTNLISMLNKIYSKYGYLETKLLNFDIQGANPMQVMQATMKKLRECSPAKLANQNITQIKDYQKGIENLPKSNVLSFVSDAGKAIIRPSGTEPKVKAYLFASGNSKCDAITKLDDMEKDVNDWLA